MKEGDNKQKLITTTLATHLNKKEGTIMQISLDDKQIAEIRTLIFSIVKDSINQLDTAHPYLTRRDIAKYFGVAESTISYWASLGMPVAIINGRKLYGKQSITEWLKQHERQQKKPATLRAVADLE